MCENILMGIFLIIIILSIIRLLYFSIVNPIIMLIICLINVLKYELKVFKEYLLKIICKARLHIGVLFWIFLKKPLKVGIILLGLVKKVIKRTCKVIIKILIKVINAKNINEIIYLSITLCIMMFFILAPVIMLNPNFKPTTIVENLIVFFAFIGMLIGMILFLLKMNSYKTIDTKFNLFYDFLIILGVILIFGLGILAMFEKVKNYGVYNKIELFFTVLMSLYTVFILLILIKIILDRGSILVSLIYGVFTYSITIIFITCAIGFFITGKYPEYFEKDKYEIKASSDIVTYMSSYSYRGAKYLLSFPSSGEFKENLKIKNEYLGERNYIREVLSFIFKANSTQEIKIPFWIYIIYFIGIIFNIIILAFFVSYAASIILLKNTSKNGEYEEYIKNQNKITDNYYNYLKNKYKEICTIFKEE